MDEAIAAENARAVDRDTLYREVWERPMTSVATRYRVSSSFLARVCTRLNVPRPPRGYWAKVEFGQAPDKPDLPTPRPGDLLEWSRDGKLPRVAKGPVAPRETRQRPTPRASRRSAHHEVLAGAREHFDAATELDTRYLRPRKRCIVDVFVSKGMVERALALAKSLFLALDKRGHRVAFAPFGSCRRPAVDERADGGRRRDEYGYGSWSPDRPTVAYVGPVVIGLTIFEFSEEVEVGYVDGKYVRRLQLPLAERINRFGTSWTHKRHMPNGRLCIRASSVHAGVSWEKKWGDAKKGAMKSQVQEIVAELEASSPTILALIKEANRQAEIRRREWEEQQERWRREEEERRRAQNIKESRKELVDIIEDWAIAKRTEEFFTDIERRLADASISDGESMLNRLCAARALLGGIDALERFQAWKSADER